MQASETSVHSFMIRLWQEEAQVSSQLDHWRGHITHIPGNQRRYIEDLDAIKDFIESHLRGAHADATPKPSPLDPEG